MLGVSRETLVDEYPELVIGTRFAKKINLFLVVLATWFLPHQIIKGIKV